MFTLGHPQVAPSIYQSETAGGEEVQTLVPFLATACYKTKLLDEKQLMYTVPSPVMYISIKNTV
jgi:hypothetical protein